jgi:CubicO group peptidase (beta-lactamase class C family)
MDGQSTPPENVGLDGTRLCGIAARLKDISANVHAVVVVRHGKLVFEQYFSGYDDPWGLPEGQFNFDATTRHDMRSVSKSVTSLLVGIAVDRKLIGGVDEPAVSFFPEFASVTAPGWDRITIRDLGTQRNLFTFPHRATDKMLANQLVGKVERFAYAQSSKQDLDFLI